MVVQKSLHGGYELLSVAFEIDSSRGLGMLLHGMGAGDVEKEGDDSSRAL